MTRTSLFTISALALLSAAMLPLAASAQQDRDARQRSNAQRDNSQSHSAQQDAEVVLPASDGMLRLSANMPQEVRVSGQFEYTVTVENVTDNIALHDIKISHQGSGPFEIESTRIEKTKKSATHSTNKSQRSGQQTANQKNDRKDSQKKNQQDRQKDNAQREGVSSQNTNQSSKQKSQSEEEDSYFGLGFFDNEEEGQSNRQSKSQRGKQNSDKWGRSIDENTWTIKRLMPGESRNIRVTASADKAGELKTCLAVTSMRPSLCLTTNVVKADLQLAKRAPEKAHVCEVIELEYFLQNDGEADLQSVTVKDDLPEGMQTIDGEKSLSFKVDGLKGGDTRKFVAKVIANKTGELSSRAVATPKQGQASRSAKATTKVSAAELAIAMDGPSTSYVNRSTTQTVRVTNVGDAPAQNVTLSLGTDSELQVAHVGDPQDSDDHVNASQSSGTPTLADAFDRKSSNEDANQQSGSQQASKNAEGQSSDRQQRARPSLEDFEQREIDLGTIEPGQTIAIDFTTQSDADGKFVQIAKAEFHCGEGEHEQKVTSVARGEINVVALSALLVTVVDEKDPIRSGDEVTYSITVKNQGDAADENVEVTAMLPGQLKFVSADGTTDAQSQGNQVKFQPVKKLEAGDSARWDLTAKASGKGEVRLEVEVKSNGLSRATVTEEPTKLFQP